MSYERKIAGAKEITAAPACVPPQATLRRRPRVRLPFIYIEPIVLVGDFLIIFLTSILSGVGYHIITSDSVGNYSEYIADGTLVAANFIAFTSAQNNYRFSNLLNRGRQLRYVTFTWLFICFLFVTAAFMLKISANLSRGYTLTFVAVGLASLMAYRLVLRQSLSQAVANKTFAERKVIVVTERARENREADLDELRNCGYVPSKIFELTPAEIEWPHSKSLQSKLDDIISICRDEPIHRVFLLIQWDRRQFIDDLVKMLRVVATPINLLPDENASRFLSGRTLTIGTTWTNELQRAPLSPIEQAGKAAVDRCLATAAIIILSPLLLIVALAIKLETPGPVLFHQDRNGFNGRKFVIYKFRTMCVLENGTPIRQATSNDPRVTRLGRWLRHTSIDELPQLFNVIQGNMSLVGPRPHAVAHNNQYEKMIANYAFRSHVKPGITGWAQVNGHRGETPTPTIMQQRVDHDIWYINNISPWLDLRILWRTMLVFYRQPNAY
jgi:undecaprenyl-phosphate galactose phosphotransferase/putative colanic acid biosynthesis UDP-glucose lipid carrier transferase